MNKTYIVVGAIGLVVLLLGVAVFAFAFGFASYAFARSQSSSPNEPFSNWHMMDEYGGHEYGMMGAGYGMMEYDMMGWYGEEGPMHETIIDALAEELNLSPREIETRHDDGDSMWEIARGEGLSDEEILQLMSSAHDTALENSVDEGWLTPEQADWMNEHMDMMSDWEFGN